MSQFADSCRVSICRLVAPTGDEEMEPVAAQPNLLNLIADCDECLEEMHQKGMNESTMRKAAEAAFAKEDSEGLKQLLASMRNRIRTRDARQAAIVPALDPAPSAPAASRAPPSSRPPIPNPSDSRGTNSGLGRQAITPTQSKATTAAMPSENEITAPAPKKPRIHTSSDGEFLVHFRAFAFDYGKQVLSRGEFLSTVTVQTLQQAFLESLPSDWEKMASAAQKSPSSTSSPTVGPTGREQ